jgi:hypothetical protein
VKNWELSPIWTTDRCRVNWPYGNSRPTPVAQPHLDDWRATVEILRAGMTPPKRLSPAGRAAMDALRRSQSTGYYGRVHTR